jgi:hypothetical protein
MSITIDLPEEVYERLEKQAQWQGRTVPEVIARLIEELEQMPRPRVVEFHVCCYRRATAFEMPRPCVVESHGRRYHSYKRETPRDKLVASERRW